MSQVNELLGLVQTCSARTQLHVFNLATYYSSSKCTYYSSIKLTCHKLMCHIVYLSGTIKRGPLSKNQKNRLDLVNIEAGSAQNETTRPRMRYRFSNSPKAPCRKASDEVPILRLARGPTLQGLERGTDSPTRPRPRT